ncbi:hypothetical protein [Burkholderia vietnamiensis]|uniref:hypothetical protein n=1 Tax=Burkholderia vietnamiensis TaxID=60552 RepID=UPI001B97831C|nr:hypothetical protein [Burkholderia vietnamiensis]MBR8035642.1 hypothetical protein [Burkholderia vietnamiensis]
MTSEVEHPVAYYVNEESQLCPIRVAELATKDGLEKAQSNALFNSSGDERLVVRIRKGYKPHYVRTGPPGRRVYAAEDNPVHNARVKHLFEHLTALSTWRFGLGEPSSDAKGKFRWRLEDVMRLRPYTWGKEAYRIIDDNTTVQHDIFGHSSEVAMSVMQPWLAIEVINTHYPEEESFRAMLETSAKLPFTVVFDFTAKPDKFLRVVPKIGALLYGQYTFLIRNGAVYQGRELTKIKTSKQLKEQAIAMMRRFKIVV